MYMNSRIKGVRNSFKHLVWFMQSTCATAVAFRCFHHLLRDDVISAVGKDSVAVKYPTDVKKQEH